MTEMEREAIETASLRVTSTWCLEGTATGSCDFGLIPDLLSMWTSSATQAAALAARQAATASGGEAKQRRRK